MEGNDLYILYFRSISVLPTHTYHHMSCKTSACTDTPQSRHTLLKGCVQHLNVPHGMYNNCILTFIHIFECIGLVLHVMEEISLVLHILEYIGLVLHVMEEISLVLHILEYIGLVLHVIENIGLILHIFKQICLSFSCSEGHRFCVTLF